MARHIGKNAEALASRLAFALSGTHGRTVSVESLRSLATLETDDWKADLEPEIHDRRLSAPLITSPIKLVS